MNNRINEKRPHVSLLLYVRAGTYWPNCYNRIPIYTCVWHMLVQFNIRRNFCSRITFRVSNLVHNFIWSGKCWMKRNCHNIHNYTHARFTCHNTLLHTNTIQHTKFLCQTVSRARKHYTKLNRHNIHNYTHTCFMHHNTLLHTTTLTNQYEFI